jgi:SAM-dependent methyltransferase
MKVKSRQLPDDRTFEQVQRHYEVEKAIAARLRKANREERTAIYQTMYDELFEQVPDHPRLKHREDPRMIALANQNKARLVEKFVDQSTVFVEFAPGDCTFAAYMCNRAKSVYGVDISDQRGRLGNMPDSFELIVYDGYNLEMPENSVDVVFSDQLIEHIHPDDIEIHFQLVRKILKSQGAYVFRTPHRFLGPHDVSRYFSDQAEGFHLKEWTYGEIGRILRSLKYSSWNGYRIAKGILIEIPSPFLIIVEYIVGILPKQLRRFASRYLLSTIIVVAIK